MQAQRVLGVAADGDDAPPGAAQGIAQAGDERMQAAGSAARIGRGEGAASCTPSREDIPLQDEA
jgi:hypothetical protein